MGFRTQDLIFTLYGDYLAARGGEVWIGHLITFMDGLDTSAQAVRSTLSRMARKGWLKSRREGRHSFYAVTSKAEALLAEGRQRIYQPRHDPWDHRWYIFTYTIPEVQRNLRHRLRQRLIWLGFGRLGPSTWISPRDHRQAVAQIAEKLGITDQVDFFVGEYLGYSQAKDLVARCWNLKQLNLIYRQFMRRYQPLWKDYINETNNGSLSGRDAFVQRFLLVHEFRSFPYVDPNLPPELLPDDWLGNEAFQFFQTYASMLSPKANQYVDEVLATKPTDWE